MKCYRCTEEGAETSLWAMEASGTVTLLEETRELLPTGNAKVHQIREGEDVTGRPKM